MISLILPSRGRPERAKNTATEWLNNAGCDLELIVSLDTDDTSNYSNMPGSIIRNPNKSGIEAVNVAAKKSSGNIIVQVAEDWSCPELWGKQIIDATYGKTDWILKTPDGIQDWMLTLPIMDRVYYNRFGYIYHPDYLHLFSDTEMSCVADLTGRRLTADIKFKHLHYSVTKEKRDPIAIKNDSTWNQGERLFIERYKRSFDLKPEQIKGKITNQNYLNWIRSKGA